MLNLDGDPVKQLPSLHALHHHLQLPGEHFQVEKLNRIWVKYLVMLCDVYSVF